MTVLVLGATIVEGRTELKAEASIHPVCRPALNIDAVRPGTGSPHWESCEEYPPRRHGSRENVTHRNHYFRQASVNTFKSVIQFVLTSAGTLGAWCRTPNSGVTGSGKTTEMTATPSMFQMASKCLTQNAPAQAVATLIGRVTAAPRE